MFLERTANVYFAERKSSWVHYQIVNYTFLNSVLNKRWKPFNKTVSVSVWPFCVNTRPSAKIAPFQVEFKSMHSRQCPLQEVKLLPYILSRIIYPRPTFRFINLRKHLFSSLELEVNPFYFKLHTVLWQQ